MKIAFFHELHFGGARRVVSEYGKVFSKNNDIYLYYVDKEREIDLENIFKKNSFNEFNFRVYGGKHFLLKLYKDILEPVKLYFLHKKIAQEIDKNNYDFVFVHPSQFTHAPFILRFLKTPTVYFCHEPLRIVHDPVVSIPVKINKFKRIYETLIRSFRKKIDYSNIRHSNLVLTNCEYSKQNIKKAYGIDSIVCFLGVDPNIFKPMNVKKEYDLIFVGRDVWIEGYDTFKEICALFKNKLKVRIVKPENGKYISDSELAKEYCRAKVLTVLGRFDPFSMIPWEGMSCGIPPVVVKEGGPIEAVRDGETGYLVERNPEKLKSTIENLLNDSNLRDKIGKQGRREVITQWTWEKSMDRMMSIAKKELSI